MREVTAAILIENGRVLIGRRHKDGLLGDQWEFPGGKVEPGESAAECLVRELEEELGMKARVIAYFTSSEYRYAHGAFRIVAYTVSREPAELALNVHAEIAWARPEDLSDYDFLPADIPIVEKLLKSELFTT